MEARHRSPERLKSTADCSISCAGFGLTSGRRAYRWPSLDDPLGLGPFAEQHNAALTANGNGDKVGTRSHVTRGICDPAAWHGRVARRTVLATVVADAEKHN